MAIPTHPYSFMKVCRRLKSPVARMFRQQVVKYRKMTVKLLWGFLYFLVITGSVEVVLRECVLTVLCVLHTYLLKWP